MPRRREPVASAGLVDTTPDYHQRYKGWYLIFQVQQHLSEKRLTDTSKFVFGLTFRPLSRDLPKDMRGDLRSENYVLVSCSACVYECRNVRPKTNLLVSVSAFSEGLSQRDAFQNKIFKKYLSNRVEFFCH